MQNKKVIILLVLSIGAVISLIYGITSRSGTKRYAQPSAGAVSVDKTDPSVRHIIPIKRHGKKTAFTSWGRNPFILKGVAGVPGEGLALGGIMWNEKNPKAMISNSIVGVGDKVGENTIVGIKRDRVILNNGTEDFVLTWEQ